MSINKKPAIDRGGVLKTDCKAIDKSSLPDQANIVKTLKSAFDSLQKETQGLSHGSISLNLFFRDGIISRYVIDRQVSFLCNEE